jgi:hypothetical protein
MFIHVGTDKNQQCIDCIPTASRVSDNCLQQGMAGQQEPRQFQKIPAGRDRPDSEITCAQDERLPKDWHRSRPWHPLPSVLLSLDSDHQHRLASFPPAERQSAVKLETYLRVVIAGREKPLIATKWSQSFIGTVGILHAEAVGHCLRYEEKGKSEKNRLHFDDGWRD